MSVIKLDETVVYVCKGEARVGLAFFIDPDHLLTCGHVVASGIGPDKYAKVSEGTLISLRYITAGRAATFQASVLEQRKAMTPGEGSPQEHRLSDIAVLQIVPGQNLGFRPKPIALTEPSGPTSIFACGADTPKQGDASVAKGELLMQIGDGRFYLRIESEQRIEEGYSGGPVFDAQDTVSAIGMVQQGKKGTESALAIAPSVLREALRSTFNLQVRVKPRPIQVNPENDQQLRMILVRAKDRTAQEEQIDESITAARDSTGNGFKVLVALLEAPQESCPEVFCWRLATSKILGKRSWNGRLTWHEDGYPLPFDLSGTGTAAGSFERALSKLLEEKLSVDLPAAGDAVTLRAAAIRHLGVLPINLLVDPRTIARRLADLTHEIDHWIAAHQQEKRPAFCLLLTVRRHQGGRPLLQRLFGKDEDPMSVMLDRLSALEGVSVRKLDSLDRLNSDRDFDPWMSDIGTALRNFGYQPTHLHLRMKEQTYGKEQEITFQQWWGRLDANWNHIFSR